MKQIDIKELHKLVESHEDINLIDVRPQEYFDNGHIPGAVHMPLSELKDHLSNLDKNATYHVICHDGKGSLKGTELLLENGYDAVNVIQGTPEYPGELTK